MEKSGTQTNKNVLENHKEKKARRKWGAITERK